MKTQKEPLEGQEAGETTQRGNSTTFERLKSIPSWFKSRRRFVMRKYDKKPRQINGQFASVINPDTWVTFDEALLALEKGKHTGIGFVLGDDVMGIDLDHVIDEDGELSKEAQEVIDEIPGYVEYSPSGKGLHIFVRGSMPADTKKHKFKWIEFYEYEKSPRYFTLTGEVYGGRSELNTDNASDAIAYIYRRVLERDKPAKAVKPKPDPLIAKIRKSKQGAKFAALFDRGAWQEFYPDKSVSEGVAGLLAILAFWTKEDKAKIDALFRQSAMFKEYTAEKWERRSTEDIERACEFVNTNNEDTGVAFSDIGADGKIKPTLENLRAVFNSIDIDRTGNIIYNHIYNYIQQKGGINMRDIPVIVFSNNKGGVAKTSTVLATGAGFIKNKSSVCYIDTDFQQGNLTKSLEVKTDGVYTSLDVLGKKCTAAQALQQSADGAWIIGSPAYIGSYKVEDKLALKGHEIKKIVNDVSDMVDCVVIDTSPRFNHVTENALMASTMLIIPVTPERFAIDGLYNFLKEMRKVKKDNNLAFGEAILMTRYNGTNLHKANVRGLKDFAIKHSIGLFRTPIREYIAVGESQMEGENIFDYAGSRSNIYDDYQAFFNELMGLAREEVERIASELEKDIDMQLKAQLETERKNLGKE